MGPHPQFTSPIAWHTRLGEARAQAEAEGKLVLVVHGRRTCAGTRSLVERTLSKEEIAGLVRERFVALASDADAAEPEVAALVDGAPVRAPTPVCLYVTAAGVVRHSTAGGRPPAVLVNDMLQACARR
jgi:hypothetical protein